MKVAISLPDDVFTAAERLAGRMRVSRSQLYARALEEYLASRSDCMVTERLDAVYGVAGESVDPGLDAAQRSAIDHEAW